MRAAIPPILYGTAWKEQATEGCVAAALAAGFRGIDTANQRKHYFEAAVGQGIARAGVPRDELFLQSKFTYRDGQDDRLPYDPRAPIATQVAQSFASSLEHLATDWLDSLVLHGPSRRDGLGPADVEAWHAMEALVDADRVGRIGISNATARQVEELVALARVPVAFVQNRCYCERTWDRDVRAACARHGIVYQGFSLLTANRYVLANDAVRAMATRHAATPAQIVFRFAQQLGMLPLTGTKDPEHMRQDLDVARFTLDARELAALEQLG
ncbi:MAG: aldo/keto reductase family protein [Acidobacteriota bacterium]